MELGITSALIIIVFLEVRRFFRENKMLKKDIEELQERVQSLEALVKEK